MASVNDNFYVGGSLELLQSTGTAPTIYYVGGGLYVVHEYSAGGETTAPTSTLYGPLYGPLKGVI